MCIQINGNTDNISATDGGLTISDLDINQSGISTFNGNIDANGDLDVDGHTNLDNVSIVGVATVTDKFVLDNGTNAGQDIQWQPTNNRLAFFDNVKATFGNTVDLQIFHNGSDSVISHISGGRGDLKILSGGSQSIECVKAGAVNIAHNGNNKLLTTATGVTINGTVVATGADIAESIAVNRPRIVLSAPNDGTNYRHLFGANLKVDSSGTFTTPTANISGGGWEYLPANSLNAHGDIRYLSAPDTNATTSTPVERLRITSAGYLNIGTDLTNSTYLVSSRGVGHNRVEIMSTDNNSAGIYLRTFNSGSQVSSATVRTDNSGNLQFYTAAGGSEGERLRITSGGDTTINGDLTVSSGTSGDAKLIIEADTDNNNESDNPTLVFKQDGGIEVSSIGHGLLSGDQNGLVLATSCTNGYMSFATGSTNGHTNATERLRIDSSGNIKLSSDVLQTLAVKNYGYSGSYKSIMVGNPNSNSGTVALCVDVSAISGSSFHAQNQVITGYRGFLTPNAAGNNFIGVFARDASANKIYFGPSTSGGITNGPLTATGDNKIGINESSPSNTLHVAGTTSTSAGGLLRLKVTTGDNFILYDNTHDSTEWAVGNDSATRSNYDVWYNNGSSYDLRTRIDANGYFSIGGTTNVGTLLHIENGSGDAYIRCRGSVNKALLFTNSDGTGHGFIGSGGTNGGGGADLGIQSNSYVVFGSVDVNVGSDYNSSNGVFTASVAGVYLFHISSIAFNNTATVFRYYLHINNSKTGSGNDAHLRIDRNNNGYANQYGANASYTYYKYMNVNDTARVYFDPDDNSAQAYGGSDYFKFSGHLVG